MYSFLLVNQVQAGPVGTALTYVFGNKPVHPEIALYIAQANKMLCTDTIGYAMNDFGKTLGLSSFTWGGSTWFDEEIISAVPSKSILEFEATHEVCHDFCWHGLKRSAVVAACVLIPQLLLRPYSGITKGIVTVALLACAFPYFSSLFELQADAKAAQILCEYDKSNVVKDYCTALEQSNTQNYSYSIMNILLPSICSKINTLCNSMKSMM
jgi:hypothetical protein